MSLPTIEIAPTPEQSARFLIAQQIGRGKCLIEGLADFAAVTLAQVWLGNGYSPSDALEAMNGNGEALFARHAALIAFLWADADYRDLFIAACERHGVIVNVAGGLPVFPQKGEVTFSNGHATLVES